MEASPFLGGQNLANCFPTRIFFCSIDSSLQSGSPLVQIWFIGAHPTGVTYQPRLQESELLGAQARPPSSSPAVPSPLAQASEEAPLHLSPEGAQTSLPLSFFVPLYT